jgi:hypothetical protein
MFAEEIFKQDQFAELTIEEAPLGFRSLHQQAQTEQT